MSLPRPRNITVEEIRDRVPESTPWAVLDPNGFENAEGIMRSAVRMNEGKKKQTRYPSDGLKIEPTIQT